MIDITPQITKDESAEVLAILGEYLKSRKSARAAAGRGAQRRMQQRLREKGEAKAARRVKRYVNRRSSKVRIAHLGVALKFHGAVLKPKNAQWLKVPAHPNAQKVMDQATAGSIFFSRVSTKLAIIGARSEGRTFGFRASDGRKKRRDFRVIFWLKKEVVYQKDLSLIPSDADLSEAALKEVMVNLEKYVLRRDARLAQLKAEEASEPSESSSSSR